MPQEIYHYDPSPVLSPDVDCPPLPSDSDLVDVASGRLCPLEAYLKTPDKGERRMMGLSSEHYIDELPVPTQERDPSSWFTSSSTLDSSWDVVEPPSALASDPAHDSESLRVLHGSEKTSSWDVLEPPSLLEPASPRDTSPDPVTLPHPFHTIGSISTTPPHASRVEIFAIPTYIKANPVEESAPESPMTREEAYLRVRHRQGRSTSNS